MPSFVELINDMESTVLDVYSQLSMVERVNFKIEEMGEGLQPQKRGPKKGDEKK